MKKIIALVLAVLMMTVCFAGCGKKDKTLTMATNASFPPYEFIENESFAGIDVEIAGKIAEKLGMTLEIVDTEFGSIIGGVQSGKYDIGMAGMTVTAERLESINFTDSYATGIQAVVVPEDSEYTSFEDFYTGFDAEGNPEGVKEGITIGVQADTTGDIYCSSEPAKWGFGEDRVVRYKTGNDAIQALASGKLTAVIIDNEPAKSYVQATEGLKILDGAFTEEQYAICVAKEKTELLNDINKALKDLTADGTIDAIIEKYIPSK